MIVRITIGETAIKCSDPVTLPAMNKLLIHDYDDLHLLWDWCASQFPHARIEPPKQFPALFVWTADYGGIVSSSLLYTWVYESDITL